MLTGLAPIVGEHPKILILGSMPSVASLEKQQYYGHPRNAFWPLLAHCLSFELERDYAKNVELIKQRSIAVWDVIGQCERPGSLDSAIIKGSEVLNPIKSLLEKNREIQAIGLNGGTAAALFTKHCLPGSFGSGEVKIKILNLPSTSPANAGMTFEQKCAKWQPLFERS